MNNQLNKIYYIAFYTFKELFKSKIILNAFILGLAVAIVTYVATEFTFGVPARVALDLGLGCLSLSSNSLALFIGVNLIYKEIESRTIYVIVSRPISRASFLIGKIAGLIVFLILNIMILTLMTLLTVYLLDGVLTPLVWWAIFFNLLEAVLLLLIVILLSLWSNQAIAVIVSLVFLMAGHAAQEAQSFTFVNEHEGVRYILEFYHMVLPGFYKLNLKEFILYKQTIEIGLIFKITLYALFYSAFLLSLSIFSINKKSFD